MFVSRSFARAARSLAAATALLCATASMAQDRDPDTLVAAFAAEGTVLDPTRLIAGVDQYYLAQMFETLVRPDPDGKMVNWLAESWSLGEEEGKTVIDVRLRKDVTFHNGDPMTSADFEFSYQRSKDPKISRQPQRQAKVERFEIVDDHHFKLHFSEPDGAYIAMYLQLYAIPKAYFESVGEEGFAAAPVGTGPWKFVSRELKDNLKLTRYDGYWNNEHMPQVKNLTIRIIPEDLTRVAAFKSGDVDWIDSVPPAMVSDIAAMDGVETFSTISGNHLYIDFPSFDEKSPFSKLEVRQAIAQGFDLDAIITSILHGQGQRYNGVGVDSVNHDSSLANYAYDPAAARELLAKAGYPNGFDTPCYNLTTQREPFVKEVGEAIFAYLQTIGVRCQVQGLEYAAWLDMMRRKPDHAADGIISTMSGQGIPSDPANVWVLHLHEYVPGGGLGAFSMTKDETANGLVRELQGTMEPARRSELIKQIGRYKHENVLGGIPTYQPIVTLAWRDRIKFKPWPFPGYWRGFQDVSIAN
ncbi:MAG: ABC transporter substrate-binding protein [Mesorhizobium sp.]